MFRFTENEFWTLCGMCIWINIHKQKFGAPPENIAAPEGMTTPSEKLYAKEAQYPFMSF